MNILQFIAGFLVVIISFLAIFINQWITFLPWLGIEFQYRRKIIQVIIALTALTVTGWIAITSPTSRNIAFLILIVILTPLSGFNHAKKALVPLTDPKQADISSLDWPEEQIVLGHISENGQAIAWTLDMLRPHHLINDCIEGKPVLAGW